MVQILLVAKSAMVAGKPKFLHIELESFISKSSVRKIIKCPSINKSVLPYLLYHGKGLT